MLLRIRKQDDVTIFDIRGAVIHTDGTRLYRAFCDRYRQSGPGEVFLLNMTKASLIDSLGITSLLAIRNTVIESNSGSHQIVVALNPTLDTLFHIAKISGTFDCFASEEAALGYCRFVKDVTAGQARDAKTPTQPPPIVPHDLDVDREHTVSMPGVV